MPFHQQFREFMIDCVLIIAAVNGVLGIAVLLKHIG